MKKKGACEINIFVFIYLFWLSIIYKKANNSLGRNKPCDKEAVDGSFQYRL